ncbi:MAG: DUF885 domain-containing protein [Phycisphaerales bacterium]|nr:DUF885 domain-containing protein [Phycisphaerales bacterium]
MHQFMFLLGFLGFLALGVSAARGQSGNSPQGPGSAAASQLHALFDEHYAWSMEQFPQEAMSKGDYTNADRLADMSLAAIEGRHHTTVDRLNRLRAIDKSKLSENDRINYELFALELQNDVDGHRFRVFLAPIGRRFGPQLSIPQMAQRVRFNSFDDYANYLKRLEQVPKLIDDTIDRMRLGLKENRTRPKVALEDVREQFASLLEADGLNALAEPFTQMPADITEPNAGLLKHRFNNASLPGVRKALSKLAAFFNQEYWPNCRQSIAAIEWPEGQEFYNYQLRVMSTTNMTATEIFELGQSEVKRIKTEMLEVIRRSDFLSHHPDAKALDNQALFHAFIKYLRADPRFYCQTPAELITTYRDICKRVDAGLPALFKTLPRLPYGVKEIPAFMAPQQTTAYYQHGDIRNSQPGYFMANTYDLAQRPKYEMIPLAMHEAVPGHHLQVALAQELENVPKFRADLWFTAYGEGWALYSERLGIEMGLYSDPYDDFGRLLYEMWRATRLVVDPGMHALGWTRDQAVQFMLDNTALSELNINNEVDRYIEWPGQAVAYKIGELRIRAMREQAEKELGPKFDLRDFHDVILGAGHLPLTMLEQRLDQWKKSAAGQ